VKCDLHWLPAYEALLLSIPATVGLILLRQPVIVLLYQRGEFDETSTQLVAWALLWFVAGLVGHTLVEILSRAFYSCTIPSRRL